MRILVMDGNTRAALAITRSLGKAGHEVIVSSRKTHSLAGASKYATRTVTYPDPHRYVKQFVEYIAQIIEYLNIDVAIPVTDITTLSICRYRDLMPASCILPFPDLETVSRVADKSEVTDLAEQLGLGVPKSFTLESAEQLQDFDLKFPVVIKPSRSRVSTDKEWLYTAVRYAQSHDDLKQWLENADKRIFPVLLQERILGPGIGVSVYCHHGRTIAAFAHRRLREKPPSGGVSVLRESIPLEPLALRTADELLNKLNWHGVAMVEFKLDQRDNKPKLMEINGRFWGSLQLAIDSGIDFPRILVDCINSVPEQMLSNYKIGVKSRWLCGDIDALLIRMLHNENTLNLPVSAPSRLVYLKDFITSFRPSVHLEVERLSDLKPAWYEFRSWVAAMLKAAFKL